MVTVLSLVCSSCLCSTASDKQAGGLGIRLGGWEPGWGTGNQAGGLGTRLEALYNSVDFTADPIALILECTIPPDVAD